MKTFLYRILFFIFLVKIIFLGFHAGLGISTDTFLSPDSQGYLTLAENLKEKGEFAKDHSPEHFRTPGYPLLLAFVSYFSESIYGIIGIQILFSLALVCMVYWMGRPFLSDKALKFTLILYSLDPLTHLYTFKIMAELFFTLVFLAALLCYGFTVSKRSHSRILLAGLLMGLSVYIRPISVYFFLCLLLLEIYRAVKTRKWNFLFQSSLFLMTFSLTILPWCFRNQAQCGYFGMSTAGAHDLYFYRAAAVQAKVEGKDYYAYRKEKGVEDRAVYERRNSNTEDWDVGEYVKFYIQESKSTFIRYPLQTIAMTFQGLFRLCLDSGSVEYLKFFNQYREGSGLLGKVISQGIWKTFKETAEKNPLLFFITLLLFPYTLFIALGSFSGLFISSQHPEFKWLLIAVMGYFILLSCGSETTARFRLPFMPYLCLLSSLFVERRFFKKIKKVTSSQVLSNKEVVSSDFLI